MADSIFNRPLFAGAGQSEKVDKAIDLAGLPKIEQTTPIGPVSFNLFDGKEVKTLSNLPEHIPTENLSATYKHLHT